MEFFFALNLNREEFDGFLAKGWRRFGYFFFRPSCGTCRECIPIRIPVQLFNLTKSQRRVMRRNQATDVIFRELTYSDQIYSIYQEHSRERFTQETDKKHFVQSFYPHVVSALQGEYSRAEELVAIGFLDISATALSSVYYFYRGLVNALCPGTFGAIKEIELAASLGLSYYYLGYYIKGNPSMAYKNRFRPYELYDWGHECWQVISSD